jgi:hypothetical protein
VGRLPLMGPGLALRKTLVASEPALRVTEPPPDPVRSDGAKEQPRDLGALAETSRDPCWGRTRRASGSGPPP